MKKSSILVGALALGTVTLGTTPSFASLRTANGVVIAEAHCGDKKAGADTSKSKEAKCGDKKAEKTKVKAKEGKCGEGKCGEGKCGGSSPKKDSKKTGK
ncbi:MAG TPA: hypothetical protein VL092_13280 [Chitinophagaceae bacterium]|nr:hypothetical protein [Chitinophagaceae bacterium]